MKKTSKKGILLALVMGAAMSVTGIATGCGEQTADDDGKDNVVADQPLVFTTEKAATIDSKAFTISVSMEKGGTLKLNAECTGKAQQQGGPGGFGPPPPAGGGGGPRSLSSKVTFEGEGGPTGGGTGGAGGQTEPDNTDYASYSYTKSGTWTEQTGWGYTFVIGEDTIHVNYDTFGGYHYFYYMPTATIDDEVKQATSAVKFTASDTAYRKTLASDYKSYEERTCTYHFYGGAEGSGGNLNATDLYLMPEGLAVDLTGRDSVTCTYGSWTKTDDVLTVTLSNKEYVADHHKDTSANPVKEGYRINKGSYYVYASGTSDYAYYDIDDTFIEGAAVKTYTSVTSKEGNSTEVADTSYTLEFTQNGFVRVKGVDGTKARTTYTGEITTFAFADTTNFVYDSSASTVTVKYSYSSGNGPFVQTVTGEIVFSTAEA